MYGSDPPLPLGEGWGEGELRETLTSRAKRRICLFKNLNHLLNADSGEVRNELVDAVPSLEIIEQ